MRALQQRHMPELKAAAVEITSHKYPFKFYLSRTLDMTEKQEQQTDQRSIRFSQFQGHTVLAGDRQLFRCLLGPNHGPQRARPADLLST